jgi:hypothetical protein
MQTNSELEPDLRKKKNNNNKVTFLSQFNDLKQNDFFLQFKKACITLPILTSRLVLETSYVMRAGHLGAC